MAVAIGITICHVSGKRQQQIAQLEETAHGKALMGRPDRLSRKRSDPIPSWTIQ
jgi:hypothetical protein